MSRRMKAGTKASTVGLLPDTVGFVLLGVVVGTLLVFGTQLGYPIEALALIAASGITAALGVRIAATERSRNLVVGVPLLWLSALGYTGGTVLLLVHHPPPGAMAALARVAVASAGLLAPFGVVSNTVQTYGQGAGSAVLRRYLVGTVVLVLLVAGLGAVSVLQVLGADVVFAPLPGAEEVLAVFRSLPARVTVALVVYTAAVLTFPWLVRSFPAEVFVPVTDLNRLTAVREFAETVSRYGLGLVSVYLVVSMLAAFALAVPDDLSGSRADAVEFLLAVTVPVTRAGASQTVVTAVAAVTGLVVVGVITLGRLRDLRSVSGAAIAEAVVPPAILFALVAGSATVLAGRIPVGPLERQLALFAAPGSPVYEIITGRLRLVLLGLGTLAILVSGLVLALPVVIAGATPGDESLAGLTASVVSLATLVVIAIFEGTSLALVLVGVAGAAVVWELGEYATVAAGELRTPSRAGGFPAGFTTLLSIHAIVTLCIAVTGAAVAVALTTVAIGVTLPLVVALPAVVATVAGLAALMLLLTG